MSFFPVAQISFNTQRSQCGFVRAVQTSTAMLHQSVTEIIPLFRWNDLPQFHLYFFRFLDVFYQSHAVHQTDTVCVCDDRRFSEHIPMIRFALLRPTPGSFNSASKSSGTFPPYCSFSIFMHALISFALLFPSPHGRTISSIQRHRLPLTRRHPGTSHITFPRSH